MPSFCLVDHAFQRLDPAFQRVLLVLVEEEAGIGKAGAQHPLVSLHHHRGVFGEGVVDGDEAGQELAVVVDQRRNSAGGSRIEVISTSRGTTRKSGEKVPCTALGYSHQVGDLLEKPLVRQQVAAGRLGDPVRFRGG